MRPPVKEIRVRVLVHATEDEGKIVEALRTLLPAGKELNRTELTGHHGNPLLLLEARLRERKEVEETLSSLLGKLEGGKDLLPGLEALGKRENLYLRLDKQGACRGRWVPGRRDEVIHLTLRTRGRGGAP